MYNFDYIILLTGQSNAVGYGSVYNPTLEQDKPDPRIWGYLSASDTWSVFDLKLQIGSKKPYMNSMAFQYAKKLLLDNPSWTIGIIICGLGSQSITRWVKPYRCICAGNHLQNSVLNVVGKKDKGDIYDWSVLMVNSALAHCNKKNNVNLIMWHQGESDFMESHTWYYQRLVKVIAQYHKETWFTNDSVFMCGQLVENNLTNKMNYIFSLEHNWKYFKLKQNIIDNVHYRDYAFHCLNK